MENLPSEDPLRDDMGGETPERLSHLTGSHLPSAHNPVLYHEIIHALQPKPGGLYVDGTLGAGGHAWGILEASRPDGFLLGLDIDPFAISLASQRLASFSERVFIRKAAYTSLRNQITLLGWSQVDGILLDLGVSSMQLDTPDRGFSFMAEAPLDMRFDPENPTCAEDLVNQLTEAELADLIFRYGEERFARQVASAIIRSRPISTTSQLADVVSRAIGAKYSHLRLHPATRTFQALRIAVNGELDSIQEVLPQAVKALRPGGRLAVIAFHSLEDRLIKDYFRQESRDCLCPPRQPICTCGHKASLYEVNRRPIQPQVTEVMENPRSRSARLRIVERNTFSGN